MMLDPYTSQAVIALVVAGATGLAAVLVAVFVLRYVERREAWRRAVFEARAVGLEPQPGETADELRARVRRFLSHPLGATSSKGGA